VVKNNWKQRGDIDDWSRKLRSGTELAVWRYSGGWRASADVWSMKRCIFSTREGAQRAAEREALAWAKAVVEELEGGRAER